MRGVASSQLCLAHDGGRVQRHRLCLSLLPMDQLVAVDAVDLDRRMILDEKHCHLVVGSVGKVCWVHLVFALSAGETLPVVAPWLRNLLLSLKHLVRTGVMLLLIVI